MQLAQACHAVAQLCFERPSETYRWHQESNNLVVLAVPDETSLHSWVASMLALGARCAPFYEPDLAGEVTACAVAPHPALAQALSVLPLAGKEPAVMG